VALRREVNDCPRVGGIKELAHLSSIHDVALNKTMPPVLFNRSEVLPIAGVGELV